MYEMSGRERFMAAVAGEEFDMIPAVSFTSVATTEAMKISNAYFPEAHTDGSEMAAIASVGHDVFGFDTVAPYFSVLLEASALGAQIHWGGPNESPYVKKTAFQKLEDLRAEDGYLEKNEFRQMLKAVRILKKRHGEDAAVIGKVIGPWTLAYNLYGVEKLVLDTILEPEKTKKVIAELSAVPIAFAKAQFAEGADAVTWAEHVTGDLVSAQIYGDFVFDVHCRVCRELKAYGPLILHVCGNVEDRIGLFAETGFDCFHFDSRNDAAKLMRIAGDRIKLGGGISNPITLARGTPSMIKKDVLHNAACGISMIGPECAIPTNVTTGVLKELTKVIHSQASLKAYRSYNLER